MSDLTRRELLDLIEDNGGPEGLDLAEKDLSRLDLEMHVLLGDLFTRGVSEYEDFPAWLHAANRVPLGINLRQANLKKADLQGANLPFANLQKANLYLAKLQEATLRGADLQQADMRGAQLQGVSLWDANLQQANLEGADLQGATLVNSNLQEAKLWGANLQEARLSFAHLQGGMLQFTDLRGVDLTYVSVLEGVYLYRASLEKTNLAKEQLMRGIGEEKDADYYRAKEAYLGLKSNFETIGRYDDASWAYIKERKMEKMMNHPRFARRYYATEEGLPKEANWRSKKLWRLYLRHTLKWIAEWILDVTCGYGESIARVLTTMLVMYVVFTLIYGFTGGVVVAHTDTATRNPIDWAIFSLYAVTTLDPPGLKASNHIVHLLASIESLVGVILLGLFGFVLTNNIRRS